MEVSALGRRECADWGQSGIKSNEAVHELEMRDATLRVGYWLESEVPGKVFMVLPSVWLFLTAE